MFFADGIKHLASGEKIRRSGWMPGAVISTDAQDHIVKSVVNQPTYGSEPWAPSLGDLIAGDWEINTPRPGAPS